MGKIRKIGKKVKKAAKSVVKEVKRVGNSIDKEVRRNGGWQAAALTGGLSLQASAASRGVQSLLIPDIDIDIPENAIGASAPVHLQEDPSAPELGGEGSERGYRSRRKGRAALRIDRKVSSSAGLNIQRG